MSTHSGTDRSLHVISFTRPSPTLVLQVQVTNAGYEANHMLEKVLPPPHCHPPPPPSPSTFLTCIIFHFSLPLLPPPPPSPFPFSPPPPFPLPPQELFHFLKLQDIDLTENEVLTQFPRRSISALHQSTSFKKAGLYPREMVFIHPCD